MLEANRLPIEYLKQAHYQSCNLVSLWAVIFENHYIFYFLSSRSSFFSVFVLVSPRKMARLIQMTHFTKYLLKAIKQIYSPYSL